MHPVVAVVRRTAYAGTAVNVTRTDVLGPAATDLMKPVMAPTSPSQRAAPYVARPGSSFLSKRCRAVTQQMRAKISAAIAERDPMSCRIDDHAWRRRHEAVERNVISRAPGGEGNEAIVQRYVV